MSAEDRPRDAEEGIPDDDRRRVRPADEARPGESAGDVIGRYTLRETVGEGGMGTVWLADQREPVRRQVALKIIKLGMDTREVLARFEAERQALALMDHPHIAKVFDGGSTAGGRPFFVMEFVAGVPITEFCDSAELDVVARLELFGQVCAAIQHAHQKGIIHRDIKPTNVLVAEHDGVPEPKVIDFGIAKATDAELAQHTLVTEHAQIVGTPEYMAPEQAGAIDVDIDTRADVYSLGVLLYELLTGTKPFDAHEMLKAGYFELLRTIREVDPEKPSTRISTLGESATSIAAKRHVSSELLRKRLRGDLDLIVMKALEKDRDRRYDTAHEFAADIARLLRDEPILAAPPSRTYRLKKFVRRNRVAVVAGVGVAVLLVAGSVGVGVAWYDASVANTALGVALDEKEEQRKLARDAEAEAAKRADDLDAVSRFQEGQLGDIDVEAMGQNMREALFEALPAPDRTAAEERLARVNFTDLARTALERDVFGRTRDAIEQRFESRPLVRARLLESHATTLRNVGLYESALDPQRTAFELRRAGFGEDHVATFRSLRNLGANLRECGELEESERRLREAVEVARRFAPESEDMIAALNSLASLLSTMHRDQEAADYQRETFELAARVLGAEHPTTLLVRSNLGGPFEREGREPLTAVENHSEILDLQQRILGPEHVETVWSMRALAVALQAENRFEEAEAMFQQAIEIHRRVQGDRHPDTLRTLAEYGGLLWQVGRLADAEAALREAVDGGRRLLGSYDPRTIETGGELAAVLAELGKNDEAADVIRGVIDGHVRIWGEDDVGALSSRAKLANVLMLGGRLEQAEACYRNVLADLSRVVGDEHAATLSAMSNYSGLLGKLGRFDESEPMLRHVVETYQRTLPEGHEDRVVAANSLGTLLWRKRDVAGAEPYFREALAGFVELYGPDHPNTLVAQDNLAGVLAQNGQSDEAGQLVRKTYEARRRLLGDEHPATLVSRNSMAVAMVRENRLPEALDYARGSYEGFRRLYGDDHPDTLQIRTTLVGVFERMGQFDAAVEHRREIVASSARVFGEEHPQTIEHRISFAGALHRAGRYPEAFEAVTSAYEQRRRALGDDDPRTLRLQHDVGYMLGEAGDHARGATWTESAWRGRARVLGADHPHTLRSRGNMAWHLEAQAKWTEALAIRSELVAVERRRVPTEPLRIASALATSGSAALHAGDLEAAEAALRECVSIRSERIPAHWLHFNAQSLLGGVLAARGRHEEADPLLRDGADGMRRSGGSTLRVREALVRLVEHYETWGKAERAAEYRELVRELR